MFPNKKDWTILESAKCLAKVAMQLVSIASGAPYGQGQYYSSNFYNQNTPTVIEDSWGLHGHQYLQKYGFKKDAIFINALKTAPIGTFSEWTRLIHLLMLGGTGRYQFMPIRDMQKYITNLLKVREVILQFMPQEKIMREKYHNNGRIDGVSQHKYYTDLIRATDEMNASPPSISFALIGPHNTIPFVFGRLGENVKQDWPYSNWVNNIPDIMLEKVDCYIKLFEELIAIETKEETIPEKMKEEKRRDSDISDDDIDSTLSDYDKQSDIDSTLSDSTLSDSTLSDYDKQPDIDR